jgi:hypothetical protein
MSGNLNKKVAFKKAYTVKDVEFETIIDNNPNDFVRVIKTENVLIK